MTTAETVSPWKHTGDPEIVDRSAGYVWKNPKIGAKWLKQSNESQEAVDKKDADLKEPLKEGEVLKDKVAAKEKEKKEDEKELQEAAKDLVPEAAGAIDEAAIKKEDEEAAKVDAAAEAKAEKEVKAIDAEAAFVQLKYDEEVNYFKDSSLPKFLNTKQDCMDTYISPKPIGYFNDNLLNPLPEC